MALAASINLEAFDEAHHAAHGDNLLSPNNHC